MTDPATELDVYALEAMLDDGEAEEVRRRVEAHLQHPRTELERARCLQYLGSALVDLSRIDEARSALQEAHDLLLKKDAAADLVEVLLERAEIELDERAYQDAETLLRQAEQYVQRALENEEDEETSSAYAAQWLDVLLATADLNLRRCSAGTGIAAAYQAVDLAESLQDPRSYFAYELLGQLLLERNEVEDEVRDLDLATKALECALSAAPDALERAECLLLLMRAAELRNVSNEVVRWYELLEQACVEAEAEQQAREVIARIRSEAASLCASAGLEA